MIVLKFGGTSVENADRMLDVAKIIFQTIQRSEDEKVSVVLSAMKGTTDGLLKAAEFAQDPRKRALHIKSSKEQKNKIPAYQKEFNKIKKRHLDTWKSLCGNVTLPQEIEQVLHDLEELLHGIFFVKECTLRTRDLILSFGERLSCLIMFYFLQHQIQNYTNTLTSKDVSYIDARAHIVTNDSFGDASVIFSLTYKNIKKALHKKINIITGFIAATAEGITTTLGRNGSDYTAALIGAAVDAQQIEIWTDVDGVLSADPRIIKDAFVVPEISYAEAMELSYFGAKVIHPHTVVPALEKNIPIVIKNTFNPDANGTYIKNETLSNKGKKADVHRVTGLASTRDASLLLVEGVGLSGNFYFLPRIFNVFASHHIKPLMITQSSSEHSICFVFQLHDEQKISKLLKEEFSIELKQKKIQSISTMSHVSIVSVIGSKMRGIEGLAGRIFNTMGKANVNIIAIAQGSNEINVSFVITKENEQKAIYALHKEFF